MSRTLDVDDFLSWLDEAEEELRKERRKDDQTDKRDEGILVATGIIREYVETMCKINEAEGMTGEGWIPISERLPEDESIYWYHLRTQQCQILQDMKKMMKVVRSILEMMKNLIQAMDYLSMPGCRYRNRIRRDEL